MLTLRITTTITVPEGVDSASVLDRFQELVETAVRADGLVDDDTDIIFDTGSEADETSDANPWFERQKVLDHILFHVRLPNGESPIKAGHWLPGQGGELTLPVAIGPRPTDRATLKVRFAETTADLVEVTCRDHRGQTVAQWDGVKE